MYILRYLQSKFRIPVSHSIEINTTYSLFCDPKVIYRSCKTVVNNPKTTKCVKFIDTSLTCKPVYRSPVNSDIFLESSKF